MTARTREVLLTGATGFLGKVVLYDLLRRRESLGIRRIHLVVRPSGEQDAAARLRREILASPALASLPAGWEESLSLVVADLGESGALEAAAAELEPVLSQILHCAASVEFDLPVADAARANVDSALEVLSLARRCTALASMVSVSTAHVRPHSGDRDPVEECLAPLPRAASEILADIRRGRRDTAALLRETGHPNTWTLSKCLAEHLLVEGRGDVPLSLVRPSVISVSLRRPVPGWIDRSAAFAVFVMAIGTGRMRAVLGRPGSRIDVVPCDEVSERVVGEAFGERRGPEPRILHAVAGHEQSVPIETCRAGVQAWFQRNPATTDRQGPARVHYLGPRGIRYRWHHWRHHLRRRDGLLVANELDQTNRRFAYFTHNTFRFQSSAPLRRIDFDPGRYIDLVCRGVAEHLLDVDLRRISIGGQRHPRPEPLPYAGALGALDRSAEQITLDLASFEKALSLRAGGRSLGRLVLVPGEDGPWHDALLELLAWARGDLWVAPPRVARAARSAPVPRPWDELQVRIEHTPPRHGESGELGRFHLVCAGLVPAQPDGRPRPSAARSAPGRGFQDQP